MGGAEYQSHVLAEELSSRSGVEVFYLARRTAPNLGEPLPYTVRSIGSSRGIRRRAVAFDALELARVLRELRPDVIYEQMRQSYAAVCAQYARRAGIPFFVHIASEWDLDPSWIPLRISPNTPFDMLESITGSWGLRRSTHVIVQTEAQGRKLRERWNIEPAVLVRNFQPMPAMILPRPVGPLRVLWVGNIKEVKRPELYVELARSLRDNPDFHFDMVGRPWDHWRAAQFKADVAALPNLTYHGELKIERVNQMMSAATFFVNTSAHEGFSNTFIQAWAHGAVLLSVSVDPYEGMENMGIGFLTGDIPGMKAKLLELSADRDNLYALAAHSHRFACDNHSLGEGAKLADAILAAAKQAVGRVHSPAAS
ncbi:MAG: glycosyltransferase family 4 protein [Steroidobacteraceae bacterium]